MGKQIQGHKEKLHIRSRFQGVTNLLDLSIIEAAQFRSSFCAGVAQNEPYSLIRRLRVARDMPKAAAVLVTLPEHRLRAILM